MTYVVSSSRESCSRCRVITAPIRLLKAVKSSRVVPGVACIYKRKGERTCELVNVKPIQHTEQISTSRALHASQVTLPTTMT